jgi:hypothetical protein
MKRESGGFGRAKSNFAPAIVSGGTVHKCRLATLTWINSSREEGRAAFD